MSVQKDASGRRWVEVEVEVPGTPEEVWEAIATGPGVSSWFVPTEVEKGEDGTPVRVVSNFGPGMDSIAKVTEWDPPRRFAAESEDLGPGAPPIATEWIVEARSGGLCVVRVVHSLFSSSEDWDDQMGAWESGWPGFFRILRLYLTHFRPLRGAAAFQAAGSAPEPATEAWEALTTALNLAGAAVGEKRSTPAGAPPLTGQIEAVGQNEHDLQLLLVTEEPAPGIAHLFAMPMGGQVYLSVRFYLYGETAATAVARAEPQWQEWLNAKFVPATGS